MCWARGTRLYQRHRCDWLMCWKRGTRLYQRHQCDWLMCWKRGIGEWVYRSFLAKWLAEQIQIVLSWELWISKVPALCVLGPIWHCPHHRAPELRICFNLRILHKTLWSLRWPGMPHPNFTLCLHHSVGIGWEQSKCTIKIALATNNCAALEFLVYQQAPVQTSFRKYNSSAREKFSVFVSLWQRCPTATSEIVDSKLQSRCISIHIYELTIGWITASDLSTRVPRQDLYLPGATLFLSGSDRLQLSPHGPPVIQELITMGEPHCNTQMICIAKLFDSPINW